MNPSIREKAEGYFITIDGVIVKEVGVNGVIKNELVAARLRDAFQASTRSKVKMFAVHTMKGAK
jgi:hypothetical protein